MAPAIFDPRALRHHRDRAAAAFDGHDFLFREAADRLVERLRIMRRSFPIAVELGARTGLLASRIAGRFGVEIMIAIEPSQAMAVRSKAMRRVVGATDWLPLAPAKVDLVVSCLDLHWIDDLPGALAQIRRALKPDGLLLVSLLGGDTLIELRRALMDGEIEVAGGVSPRVSPFMSIRDAGALLQRAGFALPVADSETLTVRYANPRDLMRDLRFMGETNAHADRPRSFTPRALLSHAARRYGELHAGPDGRVPATFEILTLTAWAPHSAQQTPLRPGSAAARLADALGASERSAGEAAGPGGSQR
jgi:SAM-dependent methyltransferase